MVMLTLCAAVICQVYGGGGKDAQKLYNKLFKDYKKEIRPVSRAADTLQVEFGAAIIEVVDLDPSGHMTVSTWLRMRWKDNFLKWGSKDFGGVKQLHVPANEVWLPDVELFNSASGDVNKDRNVIIYQDGTVMWVTPAVYTITCRHEFRGNAWTCPFRFGSWTFNGVQLDLQPWDGETDLDVSEYLSEDHYGLLENKGERRERKYDCCPEPYPAMEYILKIRGKMGQSLLLGRKKK